MSAAVCHGEASVTGDDARRSSGSGRNGWQAPCLDQKPRVARFDVYASRFTFKPQEFAMISEAIVSAPPVLAAGWSLLYLLFGGGLGGAVLIFLGLKLVGR